MYFLLLPYIQIKMVHTHKYTHMYICIKDIVLWPVFVLFLNLFSRVKVEPAPRRHLIPFPCSLTNVKYPTTTPVFHIRTHHTSREGTDWSSQNDFSSYISKLKFLGFLFKHPSISFFVFLSSSKDSF